MKKRQNRLEFPKGRQTDLLALDEIRAILGNAPLKRELLIEYLHLLQDSFSYLSARHLSALADEMKLSQVEIFETATFYAHFDLVKESEIPPSGKKLRVCTSLSCALAGSEKLIEDLKNIEGLRIIPSPCMGACNHAPACSLEQNPIAPANKEKITQALKAQQFEPFIPPYLSLENYIAAGGYANLRACHAQQKNVEDLIAILEQSQFRGLGGAGFPVARKWKLVRSYAGPRLMAVNADEGEPGTFKDRYYLEREPHRFLEGMLIAAWAVEAEEIYIYLRDEYPAIRLILERELARLKDQHLLPLPVHLRRGAGAYICGEESAMLESIEGKRGLPRHKPPFPAEKGLFGRPTLIHNVETLYWLPRFLTEGADFFTSEGRNGRQGLRSFSVSGRVKNPGVKLAPAGITARELIDEYCDGMADGHVFRAYLPGGASGGILPASKANIPLDFGTLEAHGCFIGSAAIIVLSDQDRMADVALNLLRFFEDESCGQCTPCRMGTEKAVTLLKEKKWDQALLKELAQVMGDASICGLGQAACNPIKSVMTHFAEEIR